MAKRLLLVDDDPMMLSVLRRILSTMARDANVSVDSIQSGDDALTQIGKDQGDTWFVVTDYEMPGMNGVQLLRNIREECPFADVTSVIRSSRSKSEIDSWRTECIAVLSKIDESHTARLVDLFRCFCER